MPTFQLRFYEDQYTLGRLVIERANAIGLTRRQLVERLGFADRLAKGHQVLSEMMLTGVVPAYVRTLAVALELDQTALDDVLHLTAWQVEVERGREMLAREEPYRANFQPHLQVRTERSRPEPVFVTALLSVERLRLVYLPEEINSVDDDERAQLLRDLIQRHYRDCRGRVLTFGKITGYYFVQFTGFGGMDFATLFDRHGCRIGDLTMVRRLPEATLGTKRDDARLTGWFSDTPITLLPSDDDHASSV